MATRAGLLLALLLLSACGSQVARLPPTGPVPADPDFEQVGTASWYGPGFHGKLTANGERYDMDAMTAAHRTLPFGTRVEVTNLSNGRSATFRINDRGPFIRGRIIDLSRRGAEVLGFRGAGVTKVRVQAALTTPQRAAAPAQPRPRATPYKASLSRALNASGSAAPTPWEDPDAGVHGVIVPLTTPVQRNGLVCRNYRRTAIRDEVATTYVGRACRDGRKEWEITRERRVSS